MYEDKEDRIPRGPTTGRVTLDRGVSVSSQSLTAECPERQGSK